MGAVVNNLDLGIFLMSKFCGKLFDCSYLSNCNYLIHDISVALLMIWAAGSGAWVGPGVSSKDLAICFVISSAVFKENVEVLS